MLPKKAAADSASVVTLRSLSTACGAKSTAAGEQQAEEGAQKSEREGEAAQRVNIGQHAIAALYTIRRNLRVRQSSDAGNRRHSSPHYSPPILSPAIIEARLQSLILRRIVKRIDGQVLYMHACIRTNSTIPLAVQIYASEWRER